MSNLEGAKCVGKFGLFDSRNVKDHIEARAYCKTCPVILQCAALLAEVRRDSTGGPAGGPQGTWAGRLIADTHERRQARCGTESGYAQHRRNDEEPCDDCRKGHRQAEARRYAAKKAAS